MSTSTSKPVVVIFVMYCLVLPLTIFALECYTGTDKQCILTDFSKIENGCGTTDSTKCRCAQFKFACTSDDTACTQAEKDRKTVQWAYMITTDDVCNEMKQVPSIYQQLKCCNTNKCNRPKSKEVKCINTFGGDDAQQRK
ncbi:unnamed protein product [Didymodactylos carnosus]|uniref:Uncharacterized protein n=1 Tax=Didymodactylos carnosus TaxID=1234261 RepID=A0A814PXF2_9BILA|nr:unnamed protein product [Didymodactylos carnosus]CAF1207706.1 unnamed protein product [Didymodactylos carnosus]CAF3875962.1 unnamed protein product [Didymodactylos carnosus]CAF4016890.1 unnamed protein product [Didymodactylos carnosus]